MNGYEEEPQVGDLRQNLPAWGNETIFLVVEEWDPVELQTLDLGWESAWWCWYSDGTMGVLRTKSIREKSMLIQRMF